MRSSKRQSTYMPLMYWFYLRMQPRSRSSRPRRCQVWDQVEGQAAGTIRVGTERLWKWRYLARWGVLPRRGCKESRVGADQKSVIKPEMMRGWTRGLLGWVRREARAYQIRCFFYRKMAGSSFSRYGRASGTPSPPSTAPRTRSYTPRCSSSLGSYLTSSRNLTHSPSTPASQRRASPNLTLIISASSPSKCRSPTLLKYSPLTNQLASFQQPPLTSRTAWATIQTWCFLGWFLLATVADLSCFMSERVELCREVLKLLQPEDRAVLMGLYNGGGDEHGARTLHLQQIIKMRIQLAEHSTPAASPHKLPQLPKHHSLRQKYKENAPKLDVTFDLYEKLVKMDKGRINRSGIMEKKNNKLVALRVQTGSFDGSDQRGAMRAMVGSPKNGQARDATLENFNRNVKESRVQIHKNIKSIRRNNMKSLGGGIRDGKKVKHLRYPDIEPSSTIFVDIKQLLRNRSTIKQSGISEDKLNLNQVNHVIKMAQISKTLRKLSPQKSIRELRRKCQEQAKSSSPVSLKNESNYYQWRRVTLQSSREQPTYNESTLESESRRLQDYIHKNENLIRKYLNCRTELQRIKRLKTSIS